MTLAIRPATVLMREVYDTDGVYFQVMNFRHPLFLIILSAIILVLIGLYVVERQRAVAPNGSSASWETAGGYIETTQTPLTPTATPEQPIISEHSGPETLTIPKTATPTPGRVTAPKDGSFDYNAMLAQMRGSIKTDSMAQQAESTYEELMKAFSFNPSVATPAPKTKTPEQLAIFAYGNTLGTRIKAFAAININMAQTLTDQMKDRTSVSKGNAVRDLGLRYRTLGETVLSTTDVPPSFQEAHKTLGEAYVNLGTALSQVPDAQEDQALIAAITAYNNKADAYTNAFVAMVTLFTAHEVSFEDTDGGSVFSFRR